jgi:hypothetical protein|tara:strand:+ start:761 stop:1030 length:270 start_codon:yes stop_codon:yes gene_type:complete
MTDIDSLLARPTVDAPLDSLEQRIWTRINVTEQSRRMGRIRIMAVTGALLIGVINGGFGLLSPANTPSEIGVLTLAAGLSPLASMGIDG